MIASDSCGQIFLGQIVYSQLSGAYTPSTTGVYTLEIYNYRTEPQTDLQNYIDDISLVPTTTDFSCDKTQASVSVPNTFTFSLDVGPSGAGWKHWVFFSAAGGWPGMTNNGIWVPLVFDTIANYSLTYANIPPFIHTKNTLDGNGHGWAQLKLVNPLGSSWIGKRLHACFVLYPGPSVVPIVYGSMPVQIFFIP